MRRVLNLNKFIGSKPYVYVEDEYGVQGKFKCKKILLTSSMMSARVKFINSDNRVEDKVVALGRIVFE